MLEDNCERLDAFEIRLDLIDERQKEITRKITDSQFMKMMKKSNQAMEAETAIDPDEWATKVMRSRERADKPSERMKLYDPENPTLSAESSVQS